MKHEASYWDKVWGRKYERYNRRHRQIWDAIFPYLKWRICDFGCGPCVLYEGQDVDLTGVDFSEEALAQARIRCPSGTYVQADACGTGLASATFDTVVMLGLLDYYDDWAPVIAEARRILKPGGKIVATLLNGYEGHDWNAYPRITRNWHLCVL